MNNKIFLKVFSAMVAFVLFGSINGFKVYAEETKNNKELIDYLRIIKFKMRFLTLKVYCQVFYMGMM